MDSQYNRWIKLTGATNVRDLGGYTAGETTTRWQAVYRADNLHKLTNDDQQALLGAGVRTIIDLRHSEEVQTAPNLLATHPQVRYINIPLFRAAPAVSAANNGTLTDLPTIYRYMIDHCQEGIGEALTAIAEAKDGAVLFHCTAGKDRTGIVSALLLRLAGVATDDIATEYALTAEAMALLRPIILEQVLLRGGDVEATERMLGSEAADMLALLDYIDAQYGQVTDYMQALGMSDTQVERLRQRLLSQQ
jgi:protein-tyrosine phosphatase